MDVFCVVCGEPWDYMGARHYHDMEKWEWKLFKAGAGCPGCEGEAPDEPWEPEGISDLELGDEDPMLRIIAYENYREGKAPKWERPEPKVWWTCDSCGVEVIQEVDSHDTDFKYRLPDGAEGAQWYTSHPYHRGTPEYHPAHTFEGGEKVCEFCLKECFFCHKPVCSIIDFDVYDDGYCAPYETYHNICTDCIEKQLDEEGEDGES